MSDVPPRKPERTIEELLEYSNDQLFAMSVEELKTWMGDALLAQEEILKTVPQKRASTGVRLTQNPAAQAKQRAIRDAVALLPDETQKLMRDAQDMLDRIKGLK